MVTVVFVVSFSEMLQVVLALQLIVVLLTVTFASTFTFKTKVLGNKGNE
jgi:hypothetical protein